MDHTATTQEEIRMELTELKSEVAHLRVEQAEIKNTLGQVRDRVIGTPLCPQPGLCIPLQSQARDIEQRLRGLERRDAYILGACATISVMVPMLLKYFFKI